MTEIQTERLPLRYITAEDWRSVKDIWVDFNVSGYAQYDWPHKTDDDEVRMRIALWAAANSGIGHRFLAVCHRGRVIGYISCTRQGGWELGYCFHSGSQGQGFVRESHLALFQHMKTMGITRLFARTALQNTPSVKLLYSLVFVLKGRELVSFYQNAAGNDIVFEGGIFVREEGNDL